MNSLKAFEKGKLLRSSRLALDVLTSLVVVVAGLTLVFRTAQPKAKTLAPPVKHELPVPPQPISLEGAALIGDSTAKAVMVEFSDFECPFCGKFSTDVLPALRSRYVESHRLVLAFRSMPLRIHPHAEAAAIAAICAGRQQEFGPFHDLLFSNQKALDAASLRKYAHEIQLDQAAYESCVTTGGGAQLKADRELAASLGITATPTFLIGTLTNGGRQVIVRKTLLGNMAVGEFVSAIDEMLAAKLR